MRLWLVSVWGQAGCFQEWLPGERHKQSTARGLAQANWTPVILPPLAFQLPPCRGYGESTKAIYPTGGPGLVPSVLFSKPDETLSEPHRKQLRKGKGAWERMGEGRERSVPPSAFLLEVRPQTASRECGKQNVPHCVISSL